MYARRQINMQNDGILAHGSSVRRLVFFFKYTLALALVLALVLALAP